MIQFICSLSLMTVPCFLVEYGGREYDPSGRLTGKKKKKHTSRIEASEKACQVHHGGEFAPAQRAGANSPL